MGAAAATHAARWTSAAVLEQWEDLLLTVTRQARMHAA
jgi:hypothetical protein